MARVANNELRRREVARSLSSAREQTKAHLRRRSLVVPKRSQTPGSGPEAAAPGEATRVQPLSAAEVAEIIEHERVELMQIHAMLKCLYEVLLYADDDDSVMHADVANVCARLINESVSRLESLLMRVNAPNSNTDSGAPEEGASSGSEE